MINLINIKEFKDSMKISFGTDKYFEYIDKLLYDVFLKIKEEDIDPAAGNVFGLLLKVNGTFDVFKFEIKKVGYGFYIYDPEVPYIKDIEFIKSTGMVENKKLNIDWTHGPVCSFEIIKLSGTKEKKNYKIDKDMLDKLLMGQEDLKELESKVEN